MTTFQSINPFEEIVLHHPESHLFAHVIPLGLNITRLLFKDSDQEHDLIIGPESPEDHWKLGRKFLGPIIGRYANRLPAGKHQFDNGKHIINIAEFSAKDVSLHGGPEEKDLTLPQIKRDGPLVAQKGPFDRLIWQRISSDQSEYFSKDSISDGSSSAIFGLLSKGIPLNDSEQKGYPGNIRIEVRLAIIPSNSQTAKKNENMPQLGKSAGKLQMDYRASLVNDKDDDCIATPLNLTHHWAFNLSASSPKARAQDDGKIDHHTLLIFPLQQEEEKEKGKKSKLYTLSLNDQMVPNGSLIDCSDTQHDWLDKGKNGFGRTIIHDDSLIGYDHFYTWGAASSKNQKDIQQQARLLLHSPATDLSLAFYTNQSGVQVYTTNGQPIAPANAIEAGGAMKRIHSENGHESYGNAQRSGVALEFGHPHATFLHKSYQDLAKNDTILRKGEQYHHWLEVEVHKSV